MELEEAKALIEAKDKEIDELFLKEFSELCEKHKRGFQVQGQFVGDKLETRLVVVR